ncbi:hypothetical protein F4780DRAFT_431527 [Xylariomycetidae sp. FL0641]|nr:hypothetical protein F4780DRAFT_431527 [Xylariomycetidae sp. FL0641]
MADSSTARPKKEHRQLAQVTLKSPHWSYACLSVVSSSPTPSSSLDALQVRTWLSAALRQFLGATGLGMPVDILKVSGAERTCWVRVPRDDLSAFAAAVTAWQGTTGDDGAHATLRVRGCSDWLGALVGQESEERVWKG